MDEYLEELFTVINTMSCPRQDRDSLKNLLRNSKIYEGASIVCDGDEFMRMRKSSLSMIDTLRLFEICTNSVFVIT